jgi:hypothetical protein
VSFSQCGVRVTLISTALRRGDSCVAMVASCHGCRELSFSAVDCSELHRRGKGQGQGQRRGARLLSGRESVPWCRKQQLKRCTVVRC